LNKLLKALKRKAKMKDIGERTGHSFRAGAAVDLLDKGVPFERIMLRGG
jgi:integrase